MTAAEPNQPPREAWILAGTLDGKAAYPPPLEDVAGVPPHDDLTDEQEQRDQEHGREQDLDTGHVAPVV